VRIYVDGMFFRLSGIGRCYENVLRSLLEDPDVSRVCTIVPIGRRGDFSRTFPSGKLDTIYSDFAHLSFGDFFRKTALIRSFSPRPDVLFFPNFNVPFFLKGKIVSTVNDLIPISKYSDYSALQQAGFRFLVGRALRVSTRTVCISEFGRRQVREAFDVPESRLEVIHPWVPEVFSGGEKGAERPVEGDYLLFVGNRYLYKNMKGLIAALKLLAPAHPALKAVIVGSPTRSPDDVDTADADPILKGKVVQFRRASDDQLMGLYAHASVFVFPSFMEGFGIPPLEALAYGVPVVCSDIPVIREVCEDSVRYADPFDPRSIADQVRAALTEAEENRVFAEKGRERVRRFNRERSLRQYLDLFRSLGGE
jgi:glycosyltransferase involved in cell wall biosynthesis